MDGTLVLPGENSRAATPALLMKPFRVGAHLSGVRNVVFALILILFAGVDFFIAGPTEWGIASFLLSLGIVYVLKAGIPMRTRLFRLLPLAAVLLAVDLATMPVPNSAPAGSPPIRIATCRAMNSDPTPCAQPCLPGRFMKRPADAALDPCVASPEPRGTLKDGAPPSRGGA